MGSTPINTHIHKLKNKNQSVFGLLCRIPLTRENKTRNMHVGMASVLPGQNSFCRNKARHQSQRFKNLRTSNLVRNKPLGSPPCHLLGSHLFTVILGRPHLLHECVKNHQSSGERAHSITPTETPGTQLNPQPPCKGQSRCCTLSCQQQTAKRGTQDSWISLTGSRP